MKRYKAKAAMLILILMIIFTGCSKKDEMVTDSTYMLGTYLQINIWTQDAEKGKEIIQQCFQRISDIEKRMSVNIEDSDVSKININAGKASVQVESDTDYVLTKALEYARATDGAFNPAIGKLVALWGIGTEKENVPSDNAIQEALQYVDYHKIDMKDGRNVRLEAEGMRIDLGGIAKGYAADEVAKILSENGIKKAIINLGGNVLVMGSKEENTPWKVGIQNPFEPTGTYMGVVELTDKTVVTSGNYERYFEKNGKRYHHILDPKSGYPAENGIISSTIIADKSIDADALSTGVYVLGLEKGMALIEGLQGVECILINDKSEVFLSSGIKDRFKITNDQFKVVE
ncbi:MAG: FAD:protein FMN transferase [Bacillota bacterium]